MLSWGRHSNGQLGHGGIEEDYLVLPRPMRHFKHPARDVEGIACGREHTMVVLKNGRVLSFGSNDQGQLAQPCSRKRPEQVHVFSKLMMTSAACGDGHSVAVSEFGRALTWGSNSQGQLCQDLHSDTSEHRRDPDMTFNDTNEDAPAEEDLPSIPRCCTFMKGEYCVSHVACGADHVVTLTTTSNVLCWGSNMRGQCGLPRGHAECRRPRQVDVIDGTPILAVAAGGAHSMALSAWCHVYAWGSNSFGQLGIGHTDNQYKPVQLDSLADQCVKYLSCGEDHSAVITETGRLLTFGSGSTGQLGHGGARHELRPKQVTELMGSEVTQVACGRRHTLALVGKTGRLYAFGLNGSGQLGTGDTKFRNTPCAVTGPWLPYTAPVDGLSQVDTGSPVDGYVISLIAAGGDQSFAVVNTGQEPLDMRELNAETNRRMFSSSTVASNQPLYFSTTMVDKMVAALSPTANNYLSEDMYAYLQYCLSFPAALAMSWPSRNDKEPVDFEDMDETWRRLEGMDRMCIKLNVFFIQAVLVSNLREWTPGTIEACRFFLVFLTMPLFEYGEQLNDCPNVDDFAVEFFLPFCECFSRTKAFQREAMAKWFICRETRFRKVVRFAKKYFVAVLEKIKSKNNNMTELSLSPALVFFEFLHLANTLFYPVLPCDHFYINYITDMDHLATQYIDWKDRNCGLPISFISHPFLLNLKVKSDLLHLDNDMFRRTTQMRAHVNNLLGSQELPVLYIQVRRDYLVNDALRQLTRANILGHLNSQDLRKPLKVEFMNEEGIDDGGVKKEFFILLFRDMLSADYGMFQVKEDSSTIYFSNWAETDDDLANYNLIGMLCGLAIYNNVIIDVAFPTVLYYKLLNEYKRLPSYDEAKHSFRMCKGSIPLSKAKCAGSFMNSEEFQMFASLEPTIARSFTDLMANTEDVSSYELFFEVTQRQFDEDHIVKLKTNGSKILVTNENREEYVQLYVDYILHKSIKKQFNSFAKGFFAVCESRCLSLLRPDELQALVIGDEAPHFGVMRKITKYAGVYHDQHATIIMFWDIFLSFDLETQKRFFQFLTGSNRVPVGGIERVEVIIQAANGGDDYLPVAHTCFNLLDLPLYTNKDIMCKKLLQALDLAEGFHLI